MHWSKNSADASGGSILSPAPPSRRRTSLVIISAARPDTHLAQRHNIEICVPPDAEFCLGEVSFSEEVLTITRTSHDPYVVSVGHVLCSSTNDEAARITIITHLPEVSKSFQLYVSLVFYVLFHIAVFSVATMLWRTCINSAEPPACTTYP